MEKQSFTIKMPASNLSGFSQPAPNSVIQFPRSPLYRVGSSKPILTYFGPPADLHTQKGLDIAKMVKRKTMSTSSIAVSGSTDSTPVYQARNLPEGRRLLPPWLASAPKSPLPNFSGSQRFRVDSDFEKPGPGGGSGAEEDVVMKDFQPSDEFHQAQQASAGKSVDASSSFARYASLYVEKPHPAMAAPQGCGQSRPTDSGYNLPAVTGPIMSNFHNSENQMALVGGMSMQRQIGGTMYGHHPGQIHQRNDRPFKCDQCPQSFNRNHDLKRHKRIHLAVKPFPCGLCEKSFSRKDALKRHVLVKGCGRTPATEVGSEPSFPLERSFIAKFEPQHYPSPPRSGSPPLPVMRRPRPVVKEQASREFGETKALRESSNLCRIETPINQDHTKVILPQSDGRVPVAALLDGFRAGKSPIDQEEQTGKFSQSLQTASGTGYDTVSSVCDDDTDWGEDEDEDALKDLRVSCTFEQFGKMYMVYQKDMSETLVAPILSPFKQQLIDRIMKEFWIIFNEENKPTESHIDTTQLGNCCDAPPSNLALESEGRTSSTEKVDSDSHPTNLAQQTSGHSNGKRHGDDRDDQEGDRNNGSPKRPRTLLSPPQNQDDNTKFACPYRKRDPRRYCVQYWRSCALTPLETVARVKGHLYRHHRIYPCQRCKALFKDQDAVNMHLKEPKGCELRKKKAQRDQTEAERWKEIYKLLFPDEMIPSPYFEAVQEDLVLSPDSRDLADYEDYCRRELPRDFRTALEEIVHNESQPIEESIRNQLMNLIRDSQDRVFARYRSSSRTTSATPSRNAASPELNITRPAVEPGRLANRSFSATTSSGLPFQTDRPPTPAFFQPPTPQNHLQSRLEVSDLENPSLRTLESSQQSDSGYGSSTSALHFSTPLKLYTSSQGPRQPASVSHTAFDPTTELPQVTIGMDNIQGNDGTDTTEIFDDSWMDYVPGAADDWNIFLNIGSAPAPAPGRGF